jgi:[acyl-carrier-protein] S-malonyltransferase
MKRIALLFSGQGAQHVGMGKDLFETSPAARALFEKADNTLAGKDFLKVCFEGPAETLTDTSYCQPALYVHGLALLAHLKSLRPGFTFQAAAGLSLGEFTAHAAAGTFSFEDGLHLVATRGRLMQEACLATQGGMLTLIGATEEQAEAVAAASGLQVANYNCPGQIVLSGDASLIPVATADAQARGLKKVIPLKVAGAYHSKLMQSAQDGLAPALRATPFLTPACPVASNILGGLAPADPDAIRDTLLRQVTGSVRWEGCVRALRASGIDLFLELGPGKVLQGLCKRIDKEIVCLTAATPVELEGVLHEIA